MTLRTAETAVCLNAIGGTFIVSWSRVCDPAFCCGFFTLHLCVLPVSLVFSGLSEFISISSLFRVCILSSAPPAEVSIVSSFTTRYWVTRLRFGNFRDLGTTRDLSKIGLQPGWLWSTNCDGQSMTRRKEKRWKHWLFNWKMFECLRIWCPVWTLSNSLHLKCL